MSIKKLKTAELAVFALGFDAEAHVPVSHEQPQIDASFVDYESHLSVKFYVAERPVLFGYGMVIARQGHDWPNFS